MRFNGATNRANYSKADAAPIYVFNSRRARERERERESSLTRSLINFEYNPNVAPTEQVPAFLAERSKPLATRMARFGINLASSGGKNYAGWPAAMTAALVAKQVFEGR